MVGQVKKAILYVRNLGLLLNLAFSTLIGKDPRMTISAMCYLQGWETAVRIICWIYRNPDHCKTAAQGWDDPRIVNRSLW